MQAVRFTATQRLIKALRLDVVERALGRLSASLILWLAIVALTAIFAIFAYNIYASRRDVTAAAHTASGNLVASVAQQIAREVELLDLSLQDLCEGARITTISDLPFALRQSVLFDRAATAHGIGALLLLDTNGHVIEQAGVDRPAPVNFAGETFFKAHADAADVGFFVSRPFVSLVDGEPSIALSRRVERDGRFLGVAVATIRTSYFKELFASLDLGAQGTIALMAADGVLIMRQPFVADAVGRVTAPPAFMRSIATHRPGFVDQVSTIDGIRRVFFHTPVGTLPMVLVLGRSVSDIYAPWWNRAIATAVALLLLGNLILLLIAALEIALRDRAAAEAELATLARTDKLTALANRRLFDESLDAAWRRMERDRRPLALMILDIDYFKDFNDVFGHQGGDAVLAAMGACLACISRRPDDLVARYGGEEFAILLPDTGEEDAHRLAVRVEAAVQGLAQPHPRSPTSTLTVSIGVAVLRPTADGTPGDLVRMADAALYRAKRTGRNRIAFAPAALAA